MDRCLGFIDHVKKEVEEETAENLNILVVSHGGFMKQLYMHITSQFEASNLGIINRKMNLFRSANFFLYDRMRDKL